MERRLKREAQIKWLELQFEKKRQTQQRQNTGDDRAHGDRRRRHEGSRQQYESSMAGVSAFLGDWNIQDLTAGQAFCVLACWLQIKLNIG